MLEVGVTNVQKADCGEEGKGVCRPLTTTEARTHFAAWSIVSAPLVLGFNFSDTETVHQHWDTSKFSHKFKIMRQNAKRVFVRTC